MHEVDFHRLADQELRQALKWYRSRSAQAGERFRANVLDVVSQVLPIRMSMQY
jgi:hypothetical protein